jgi:hypothetical protein
MSESEASPEVKTLWATREEAQRTFDAQLSTLDDIDSKAVTVFRLNVALAGLLFPALSFAAASEMAAAAALLNPATGLGVALFVLSAAVAGLTDTVAGQEVGVGPTGLRRMESDSERVFLADLVDGYTGWIGYNERTNVRKALLVTLAVVGTVAGALALGVGALAAFTDLLIVQIVGAVLALTVFARVAGLPSRLRRLLGDSSGTTSETVAPQSVDRMIGQRTFEGRDRED